MYTFKLNILICWLQILIATVSSQISTASIGLIGDANDVNTKTVGATILVGGGEDVDEVYKWMIERAGGGDFVVLRAAGTDAYNSYIYQLGPINSVETLLIDSRTLANDPLVEKTILDAEAVFISGGDQANYVNFWKNTKVHYAVDYVRNVKKIPVGGTSAGCAILGGAYFGALEGTIISSEALTNPYISLLTVGYKDFLNQPYLSNVITDSHFDNRDRHGRLVTFLARLNHDHGILVRGIGLDESTAVCIESNGIGQIIGTGYAYFLTQNGLNSTPETCQEGLPLHWDRNKEAVKVYKVQATTDGSRIFDLTTWAYGTDGIHMYYYVRNGILYRNYN